MDKTIDDIFFQVLNIKGTENTKEISHLLVTLNYLLPSIFQEALALVELHRVVRKDSVQKKDSERGTDNIPEGVFTRHEAVFTNNQKSIWTVQSFIKEKKGTYKAAPLQGTAFGYVVDLDMWNCSCQEFTKSKYTSKSLDDDTSSQLSNLELINHCKSGWGSTVQYGTSPMNFRVPVCVHIVAVFVFSRGRRLFSWIEGNNGDTELAGDASNLFVDGFTSKKVGSVEEWIVLTSL